MALSFLQKMKLPPLEVFIKALVITVIAVLPLFLIANFVGIEAVFPSALVLMATLGVAPIAGKSSTVGVVVILSLLTACTVWAYGSFPLSLLLIAISTIYCAAANRWSSHALITAPIIVIIFATQPLAISSVSAGFWALMGGLYGALIVSIAKISKPAKPVPHIFVRRYAVVLTISCLITSWAVFTFHLPHGYWLVISLVAILSPYPSESKTAFRQRIPATFIGVILTTLITLALPQIWVILFAYLSVMLMIGYVISGNSMMQTVFLTPALLLLISAGVEDVTIILAVERLVWTVVGAIIAALLAALLYHFDKSSNNVRGDETTSLLN